MAAVRLCLLAALLAGAGTAGAQEGAPAAWERAAALPAGDPARADAVAQALALWPGPLDPEELQLAWAAGVEAAGALRLERAIEIQTALEARHPAPWSGMDLALTLGLAGRLTEAERVLERTLASTPGEGRAELCSRRGLLWLGAGDERRARDHLGRALALGSADAALVLAWLDLERGRPEEARAGFRAGLYDDPPGAWALRGWGLTLLPDDPRRAPRAPANPEDSDR